MASVGANNDPNLRRLLVLSCAVIGLDTAFFAVLAPLLPSLTRDMGISSADAGVLSGAYAAGVLVFALPAGWLTARIGQRNAVVVGLVGIGSFSTMFGFASNLHLLEICRFFQGASGALMWSGAMSWVIAASPSERRGAMIGVLVAAATVGELIGAPIGAIAESLGLELVFGAVGVLAALLIAVALKLPAPSRASIQPLGAALRLARDKRLLLAAWMLAAASLAFGVVVVMMPLRVDELGGSAALIAASFALGSIIEALLGPRVGAFSDRAGRGAPYILGAILGSAGLLLIAAVDVKLIVVAAMVVFAFGAGLAFTPSMAMATDVAAGRGLDQGYASGVTNAAFGGGQMLGAVGAGALAAQGYLLPALIAASVFGSAALLARRLA